MAPAAVGGAPAVNVNAAGPQQEEPFRPAATTDAYNEAKFMTRYLELDSVTRERIGHRFGSAEGARGAQVRGFVSACTYRGTDCLDER